MGGGSDAPRQLAIAIGLLAIAAAAVAVDVATDASIVIAVTGVVIAITASAGLFVGANGLASLAPESAARRIRPWIFVGPALIFVGAALVVPTIRTVYLSMLSDEPDNEDGFVFLENFQTIFTEDDLFSTEGLSDMFTSRLFFIGLVALCATVAVARINGRRVGVGFDSTSPLAMVGFAAAGTFFLFALFSSASGVIWNNLWWVFAVTAIATGLGLAVAVLADQTKGEAIAKSLIFTPMAISFVGSSIIWRFVYAFRPQTSEQIGLLNAFWRGLGGDVFDPLQRGPWNTFFLIVVLIWAHHRCR